MSRPESVEPPELLLPSRAHRSVLVLPEDPTMTSLGFEEHPPENVRLGSKERLINITFVVKTMA
jgi:hypothetical protein